MADRNLFFDILQSSYSCKEKAKMITEKIRSIKKYSWVGLYDVDEKNIFMIAYAGKTEPAFPVFPRTKGLNGRAIQLKKIVVVNNTAGDMDYLITFGNTQSEMIVPVYKNDEVAGTIDVESEFKNAFGDNDINFLQECAIEIATLWND